MIFSFSCVGFFSFSCWVFKGGAAEALSRLSEESWTVHDAQLRRRRISAFDEVDRFVVANRGAQTPTPQMVSPPGDLLIRRDD